MQDYHYGRDRWYKADEVDAELNKLNTELNKLNKRLTEELTIKNGELNALEMQNEELESKLVQANAIVAKVKEALNQC